MIPKNLMTGYTFAKDWVRGIRKAEVRRTFSSTLSILILAYFHLAATAQQPNARQDALSPASLFFQAQSDEPAGAADPLKEAVIRRTQIGVDFELLKVARRREVNALRLNLFDDVSLDGRIEEVVVHSPSIYSIVGTIAGHKDNSFLLTVNEGIMFGEVHIVDGRHYTMAYTGGGIHTVRQIDDGRLPPCGLGPEKLIASVASPSTPEIALEGDLGQDDESVFDLSVVYTPAARAAGAPNGTLADQIAATQTLIDSAVQQANQAYRISRINSRMRLVHSEEVAYAEISASSDLSNLTGKTDGYMDNVHPMRDLYQADLVSLLMQSVDGVGGQAHLMHSLGSPFESSAFSVFDVCGAIPAFILAHEAGHNMGCSHDNYPPANETPGIRSYSWGWRFPPPDKPFRTIMAGDRGVSFTIAGSFSNPEVTFLDYPTGVAVGLPDEAFNARSINEAAGTVANWRLGPPQVFVVRDSAGQTVLWFDSKGNFVSKRYLTIGSTPAQLVPSPTDVWILRDALGSVVVRVAPNGDVYLKGSYTPRLAPLTLVDDVFTIRDGLGAPVAFFNRYGDLRMAGEATIFSPLP